MHSSSILCSNCILNCIFKTQKLSKYFTTQRYLLLYCGKKYTFVICEVGIFYIHLIITCFRIYILRLFSNLFLLYSFIDSWPSFREKCRELFFSFLLSFISVIKLGKQFRSRRCVHKLTITNCAYMFNTKMYNQSLNI